MPKREKTGGRKAGTPNKATQGIKDLLAELFDDEETKKRWLFYLNHKDPGVSWKAFELYNAYRFCKPPLPVVGSEQQPPVKINISAIPMSRKRAE